MITLSSLSLPSPASLSVHASLQGGAAQYNTLGQLVQDGMQEKRTVEILWTRLSASILSQLAQALQGGFLTCVYPDPLLGERTMRCRCASHSARVFQYLDGAPVWADVKITLEEQ